MVLNNVFFIMYVTSDLESQWSNCQLKICLNLNKNHCRLISTSAAGGSSGVQVSCQSKRDLAQVLLVSSVAPCCPEALSVVTWLAPSASTHQPAATVISSGRRIAESSSRAWGESVNQSARERLLLLVVKRDFFKWGNWDKKISRFQQSWY